MLAKFEHTNRLYFRNLLIKKLGEDTSSFRSEVELNQIIEESLLTFGAAGQAWKNKIRLDITSTNLFYDITTDTEVADLDLIKFSLTYQFIIDRLNAILFEEISTLNPTGQIITLDEILKFCRNRVNQFQFQTGLIISRDVVDLLSPPINEKIIADEIIDLIRVAYIDLSNNNLCYKLREEDEASLGYNSSNVFVTTKRVPDYYTSALGTLNQIFLYPPPANLGKLEILSIKGISAQTTISATTVIPLPNNLVPYILFGVLADVFAKDGVSFDLSRASYCEERWNEGIIIGSNYSSILQGYLNGVPISLDSITSLDNNQYGWQNSTGKPSIVATAGYNLLATNKIVDVNYSLLLQVITNAYLPTSDDDFIDIKLEYIEPLLNYCVHLALIKDGIAAIKQSDQMRQEFLKVAVSNNIRLIKRGQSIESMFRKVKLESADNPIREEAVA